MEIGSHWHISKPNESNCIRTFVKHQVNSNASKCIKQISKISCSFCIFHEYKQPSRRSPPFWIHFRKISNYIADSCEAKPNASCKTFLSVQKIFHCNEQCIFQYKCKPHFTQYCIMIRLKVMYLLQQINLTDWFWTLSRYIPGNWVYLMIFLLMMRWVTSFLTLLPLISLNIQRYVPLCVAESGSAIS